MKQIRRAEMENERSEERDNHDDNDNDVKKFTEEAKGSKHKGDDFTTEETGGKAKAGNLTEAKDNKAKGWITSQQKQRAAKQGLKKITTGMRRQQKWSMNKEKSSHLLWEEKFHAMKSGWSLTREQRQEYKQVKRDKEWENSGKVNGGTPIGENDLTIGE